MMLHSDLKMLPRSVVSEPFQTSAQKNRLLGNPMGQLGSPSPGHVSPVCPSHHTCQQGTSEWRHFRRSQTQQQLKEA